MDTHLLTAADVMTCHPCAVDADLRLSDAADRMEANGIRHLLVLLGCSVVGAIRDTDVLLVGSLSPQGDQAPVSSALIHGLPQLEVDAPLSAVAEALEQAPAGCVAVYERGDVVGIITHVDLVHALRELLEGQALRRLVRAHHTTPVPRVRPVVPHGVRTSEIIRTHGAAPTTGPHVT